MISMFRVVAVWLFLSLRLINIVTGQSQACIDAQAALNQNSECQQAFTSFNIETDTGDDPLCSGTCRNLLDNIANNCPDSAEAIGLMLSLACTSVTGPPTLLPDTPQCTQATQALALNQQCRDGFVNINNPEGVQILCGHQTCRNLLLIFLTNCPNQYFDGGEITENLDVLCNSGTAAGTAGTLGTEQPVRIDCGTAVQQFEANEDCYVPVDDIEEISHNSTVCSLTCRMLLYIVIDSCPPDEMLTREAVNRVCSIGGSASNAISSGAQGLIMFTLLLSLMVALL